MKNECEDLLNSVIQNWSVLKTRQQKDWWNHFYNGAVNWSEQRSIYNSAGTTINDLLLEYIP